MRCEDSGLRVTFDPGGPHLPSEVSPTPLTSAAVFTRPSHSVHTGRAGARMVRRSTRAPFGLCPALRLRPPRHARAVSGVRHPKRLFVREQHRQIGHLPRQLPRPRRQLGRLRPQVRNRLSERRSPQAGFGIVASDRHGLIVTESELNAVKIARSPATYFRGAPPEGGLPPADGAPPAGTPGTTGAP